MVLSLPPLSVEAESLYEKLEAFVTDHCIPSEPIFSSQVSSTGFNSIPPILLSLISTAKSLGLWNLHLLSTLSHLDYARLCCVIGRSFLTQHATNTTAPDSGNMEVLHDYGTPEQKSRYLAGLKDGSIRSAFCMTEPEVASSDARNVGGTTFARSTRDGRPGYFVNGRKWWSTGAHDPRCRFMIVMGKLVSSEGEKEKGHTMVIVPRDCPGLRIVRDLTVFGHDDAPFGHAEVEFKRCWIPLENCLGGEGEGGRIAQSRLGPGRIHHCMRAVGLGERCYDAMIKRSLEREVRQATASEASPILMQEGWDYMFGKAFQLNPFCRSPPPQVFGKVMIRHGTMQSKVRICLALTPHRLPEYRSM